METLGRGIVLLLILINLNFSGATKPMEHLSLKCLASVQNGAKESSNIGTWGERCLDDFYGPHSLRFF